MLPHSGTLLFAPPSYILHDSMIQEEELSSKYGSLRQIMYLIIFTFHETLFSYTATVYDSHHDPQMTNALLVSTMEETIWLPECVFQPPVAWPASCQFEGVQNSLNYFNVTYDKG